MKKIFSAIIAACAIFASSAFAISAPQTHDGFFLHLAGGFGYGSFSDDIGRNTELKSEGIAFAMNYKIGGAITPNFILHATVTGASLFDDLAVYYRGEKEDGESLEHDGLNLFSFGIGSTFYFYENMFASASIGISDYSISLGGNDYDLDFSSGLSFSLTIGKEWWVSPESGIGLEFEFTHTSGKDDANRGDVSSNTFSLLFSFTYN